MSNSREIAKALYNHDKAALPSDTSPEVEREWRRIRQEEHNAPFARLSAANDSSVSSDPISGIGGLAVIGLLLILLLIWMLAGFSEFLQGRGPRATMILALVVTWLVPPVGIVTTLPLVAMYQGGNYFAPELYLVLLVPVGLLLHPLCVVRWHTRATRLWRHSFVAILFFASVAKGQLQVLATGQPAIPQNASVFLWAAVVAACAVLVSMIASRIAGWLGRPFASPLWLDVRPGAPTGKLGRIYGVLAVAIYGSGYAALALFAVRQLFYQYSYIGEWT